jgi:Flp pilus assembly protein TadD
MPRLDTNEAEQQFKLALKALDEEDFTTALAHLENALELHDNPDWHSYAGLCIALERGDFPVAEHLCLASIEHDESNPVHYLNLGKVYLAAGKKCKALEILHEGMALGGTERILALLFKLEKEITSLPSLKRSHPSSTST